jgi:hypothetical protein
MDISFYTNSRFELILSLATLPIAWTTAYPLETARFASQIRTKASDPIIILGWDSFVAPASFQDGALIYSAPNLTWIAPSTLIESIFPATGGDYEWDFGFYLPAKPTDFIRIDGGAAHALPGVTL